MSETKTCARCGAVLASGDELCPRCLLALGRTPENPGASVGTSGAARRAKKRAAPTTAEIAQRFPELEVIALIGEGGMGAVYKARQTRIERGVALKVLALDPSEDPTFAERFRREALVLARLDHPNVVKLYDFGERDGLFFLVLEFVDGANLRSLMKQGLLTPRSALAIVPQMCEALQFAHDEGIVHRDIKPENVLIDAKGRVKIADFGLAKLLDADAHDVSLTEVGQVMGTPHYMAPEQLRGARDVDHRADIYSLGVVFYEMLTGELPRGNFELPSKTIHVDVRLDEIVLKSLERTPERRYQHAIEVKTDVESVGNAPHNADPGAVRGSLSEQVSEVVRAHVADRIARGEKAHRGVVIPGRPWEFFAFFLMLWPLAGFAFNVGEGWFAAAMILIAILFVGLIEHEIKARPDLRAALRSSWPVGRRLTATILLIAGFFAIYLAHVHGFQDLSHQYRSGPDDPNAMNALETRLLPMILSRIPLEGSLAPGYFEFTPKEIWALDRMRPLNPLWLALLAEILCALAALTLSARFDRLNEWKTWIPALRSCASLFGALLLVHGTCALIAMMQVEGGPLVNVLADEHGLHPISLSEQGTEDVTRRLHDELIERHYPITASGTWSYKQFRTVTEPQEMRIIFTDPDSPFDRWRMTWTGPKRIQPHAIFIIRGPRDDGRCTLECDLGDVARDDPERRAWSEWFATLLH